MIIRRTSSAGVAPVRLDQVKAHLRVTASEEDNYIDGLTNAACVLIGERAGRVMSAETWKVMGRSFSGEVKLPKSPVSAVTAVEYYDTAGTLQAATLADYTLVSSDDWAFVAPKAGAAWPSGDTSRLDAVSITFTAGYSRLPTPLHHAALMLVGHWYTNREAVGQAQAELPLAVESLVSAYRLGWASA